MDNPYSALEQEEPEEFIDFIRFRSLVSDVKVKLPEPPFHEPVDKSINKTFFSQLTCSSKYGYFAAACQTGFVCGQTEHLYDCIHATEKAQTASLEKHFFIPVNEGGVKFLALSQDELQLIVGRENASPVHSIALNNEIISINPNPEVYPDLVAVCVVNDGCKFIQLSTGQITQTIPDALVASWSPKGKQIACGNQEGIVSTIDITGKTVDAIPPPADLESNKVRALLWLENHTFLVVYGSTEVPDAEHVTYIINRKSKERYQLLNEITPIYNDDNCDNQFYMSVLRNFGTEAKTMVIIANAISSDLAVVGQHENGTWKTWTFEDNCIPLLPLSDDGELDTFPVGIAVDFSSSKDLPPFDPSESDTPVPPAPIFLLYTNEGRICAYHIYNTIMAKAGERYSAMVNAQDVFSIPTPSNKPSEIPQPIAPPTSTGPFNAALNNTPAFGAAPAFGAVPAFGAPSNAKIPSFSDMRVNASNIAKPSMSVLGSTQPAVVFGAGGFGGGGGGGMAQKSSFAALAKTSTQPGPVNNALGASTFGNAQPAFGSPSTLGNTQPPAFGKPSPLGNIQPPAPISAFEKRPSLDSIQPPAFEKISLLDNNQPPAFDTPSPLNNTRPIAQEQSLPPNAFQKDATFENQAEMVDHPPKEPQPVETKEENELGSFVMVDGPETHEEPEAYQISNEQMEPLTTNECQAEPYQTSNEQDDQTLLNKKVERQIEQVPKEDRPVEDVLSHRALVSRPNISPRFASLSKKAKANTTFELKATHPIAKEFEKLYMETKTCIEDTGNILVDIEQELNFHQTGEFKDEEYLENADYEWKRGDTHSIGFILDRLNASMPTVKEKTTLFYKTLSELESSIDNLVDHAERLNGMEIQDKLEAKDLEEIKEMGVDVQYNELLKIMERKKESIKKLIATTEENLNDLKKKLDLATVPSKHQH
ncbi:hypothetical protein G6F56_005091 [Rhizopus delemar]|nr:hypothetical protein G6F56_005091 [Rhizopus delemar]